MNPSVSVSSTPAVRPNPLRAFGGIWRLTWRRFCTPGQWLLLLGTIVALGALSLLRIRHNHESEFMPWIAQFYLGFIVPVMAFLTGAAAIRDEMKSATADYVLTRPVRRAHLVVFKFLSHVACLQLFYLVVLGSLLALASFVHVPDIADSALRILLAQLIALTAFSALGFLFGVLSERYLVFGLIYAGTVEMAIGRIPTQLNHLSMTRQLSTLVQLPETNGFALLTGPVSTWSIVALLLCYTALFVALCAIVFSRRELVGAGRSA